MWHCCDHLKSVSVRKRKQFMNADTNNYVRNCLNVLRYSQAYPYSLYFGIFSQITSASLQIKNVLQYHYHRPQRGRYYCNCFKFLSVSVCCSLYINKIALKMMSVNAKKQHHILPWYAK